ncbi:MAG: septum formation initiator family protein [Candidatus Nealsonbacteria bacterium]|nr:septum formation initiator family protein [Candidatus Nealsonbacteria bacterium]
MVAKFKKKRKRRAGHNIIFPIFLAAGFILIIGFLFFNNWRINRRRAELTARIDNLRKEIAILEQKNKELKEDISQAATENEEYAEEYLERVAREQLGLKAPGEEVVVISREERTGEEPGLREEKGFWNPSGWLQKFKSIFKK